MKNQQSKEIKEENIFVTGEENQINENKERISVTDPTRAIKDLEIKTEEKLKKIVEDYNSKIHERETKTTEILSIYITLFTFISVNVSIFTKVETLLQAILFMILMTLSSIFLVSYLIFIVNNSKKPKYSIFLIVIIFLLMILVFKSMFPNLQFNKFIKDQKTESKIKLPTILPTK